MTQKAIRNGEEYLTVHTARAPKRCETDRGDRCRHTIAAGERYTVAKLPPRSDLGNDRWWRMRVCSTCRPIPEGTTAQ